MNYLNIGKRYYSSASSLNSIDLFPSVRRLLKEYNIVNLKEIKSTGPRNRLLKGDVLNYIETKQLKPIDPRTLNNKPIATASSTLPPKQNIKINNDRIGNAGVTFEDIPHNNIRKVIASKLTQSKQKVPHLYMTVECDISKVLELRQQILPLKVSVNDFVMRAVALALRDNPDANAKFNETTQEIEFNKDVDVSFAVSTEKGLITPIIKSTDTKQLTSLSKESKDLALLARDGKLKPEQFIGGTFSVSNLGMFGISYFNAIINYPQAGILAIGTGRKIIQNQTIDLDNDTTDTNISKPKIIDVIDVTLSGDNRVFTDEIAAKFLQSFRKYLSNPESMML